MASWGKCDYKKLVQLRDKMKKFAEVDYDKIAEECCNEIASRLIRSTKKQTPFITGTLKGSWDANGAIKRGGEWRTAVYNPTKYGIYVEYGHRTRGGGWRTGRFMLTKSEKSIESIVPKLLEKKIMQKLGEVFD